jgi:hypothetical protein
VPYMRPWEEDAPQQEPSEAPAEQSSIQSPYGIQMGDRVQYVQGISHPELNGQSGVVLRTHGDSAVVQLDTGQRTMLEMSGLQKTSMIGDSEQIAAMAEEVFDGGMEQEDSDMEPDVGIGDAGRAVYHGEDRDVTAPPGEQAATTAAFRDATPEEVGNRKHQNPNAVMQVDDATGQTQWVNKVEINGINGQIPQWVQTDPDVKTRYDQDIASGKGHDAAMENARFIMDHKRNKRGNMNVESKWQVLALGEKQQPGGVGATMHDPALDGPNMDGPNFADNSDNGFEQEVALKRWVDTAVDLLNRGEDPDLVLAKLAHDGCPEPEIVLQHALEQPEKDPEDMPVSDEPLSQDLPAPANPDSETAMSMPSGVSARVKVGHVEGTLQGYYKGQWGEPMARVALDNGQVRELPASEVQEIATAVDEPVEQVEQFINSFPEVDEQRQSSIEKRVAHINAARNRISTLMHSGIEDRQRLALDAMDVQLHKELADRKNQVRHFHNDADLEYLAEQPKFDIQVAEQESIGHGHKSPYFLDDETADQNAEVANTDFDTVVSEDSAIMVSELPASTLGDLGQVHQMAAKYIDQRTAGLGDAKRSELRGRFVEAVLDEREKRLAELNSEPDDEPDTETPIDVSAVASDIFL